MVRAAPFAAAATRFPCTGRLANLDLVGFVHGTWTMDGQPSDRGRRRGESSPVPRRDGRDQAINLPGTLCVVYDVAEVAAQVRGANARDEFQLVPTVSLRVN